MNVQNIISVLEELAPLKLKEDFDNVGLMVGDRKKEVKKVLLALDCTLKVIDEAKEKNIDLIITHHPLIFSKPKNITTDTLQGRKIIELIKNDISLYSSHTNLDSAENGLNKIMADILELGESKILCQSAKNENCGLGRIIKLKESKSIDDIIELVKEKFEVKNLRVVKSKESVSKIGLINGSGQSFIEKAIFKGADTIITGDTTYHFASDYKELKVNIIDIGHFKSEHLIFLKSLEFLKEKFEDIEFISSEVEKDPYTFI